MLALAMGGGCDAVVGANFDVRPRTDEPRGGAAGVGGAGGTLSAAGGALSAAGGAGGGSTGCVPEACPGNATDCREILCINDMCALRDKSLGTACDDDGGSYCDGGGSCVECTTSGQCAGPAAMCIDFACYAPACDNGTLDVDETDVDCGGECPPCSDGLMCVAATDCQTLHCDNGVCDGCANEAECPPDHYCEAPLSGDACKPKLGNGELCVSSNMCLSGCCSAFAGFSFCAASSSCN